MFERFTDRARRVVVLAQENARMMSHNYIGSEHILLGLLDEAEGVGAKVLASLNADSDEVREHVLAIIGQGAQTPSGHIPFTPRAKRIFELSLREALQLGHPYIGTEHILLGLIREGEGVGAQVLGKMGIELNRVRQTTIQLLSSYITGVTPEPGEILANADGLQLAEAKDMMPSQLPEMWREIAERSTTERGMIYRALAQDLEDALKNVKY